MGNLNSLKQNVENLPRKVFVYIVVSFAVGVLAASLFWQNQIKDTQSIIDYRNFELKNLQEQVVSLREDVNKASNPTPTPSPIRYVKKENLEGANVYTLSCYDKAKDKTVPDWVNSLQSKLESGEKLVDGCLNGTLNKVALISTKQVDPGGFGRPGADEFRVAVYSLADNNIEMLSTSQGSYLGGFCTNIVAWTKTGNIYYKCGGGDGPWSTTGTLRVHIYGKDKGITESCYTFESRTSCTNYCQSASDCQQGYLCNLEKNICVQPCKTYKDCVNSDCVPLGPITACKPNL